jgi:S-sulfo-L-cysteine synthase (O-acetyl-L-serine-dependent)
LSRFDLVGNTPLVRLSKVLGDLSSGVEVWAKLEAANPGGSVKDRAARAILQSALRMGIPAGARLLDSSSGNTGIAYGMFCAELGIPLTLVMPANANRERKRLLAAYGVELVLSDPLEGSDGAIRKAQAMASEEPGRWVYLDQYGNAENPRAHELGTAEEIWQQTGGRVTHWVAGLGTTGTFVGTARGLRKHRANIVTVAVQPEGPFHGLEGLKHLPSAIQPAIYDEAAADRFLWAPTEPALELRQRLGREEGILAGPSSGAALWGAIEVARELREGVVVTLFPDGGERYVSEDHLWD